MFQGWETVVTLMLIWLIGLAIGFKLGMDCQFNRIMNDPGIRFAIEMGRRMKEKEDENL